MYYGYERLPDEVATAFDKATLVELLLIARARTSRVTFSFSEKSGNPSFNRSSETAQKYGRGNVAILPQDPIELRSVLPPDKDEVGDTICALFMGGTRPPTKAEILKVRPFLVSKHRVEVMLDFLISNNRWYREAGVNKSRVNIDMLVDSDNREDSGIPAGVEISHMTDEETQGLDSVTSGYASRGLDGKERSLQSTQSEESNAEDAVGNRLFMEAVGYTAGERRRGGYREMKSKALAWCLDKKKFIRVRAGSAFVDDRDPGLLSWMFPHLDPWGIGGFYEPCHSPEQHISFGTQVRQLLQQHDSHFQRDANFAYKREVSSTTSFRTDVGTHQEVAADLALLAPHFSRLMRKWEISPFVKADNVVEKKAMSTLRRIKLVGKNVKGSAGYKQCRRNEIRAIQRKLGPGMWFVAFTHARMVARKSEPGALAFING
ncbi:hypothetical protein OE88DRAFT_1709437 [Heliocybe sulcata]|uniref:DUF6570 domain-containing protein n=1 Tax=Heliocybe sulcata TaxID=5364 RepID=A0A5C3NJH4_9AGAM|nr:hypothetical protein OE88DRAFT_1709437 [Heliocybe sulcata]